MQLKQREQLGGTHQRQLHDLTQAVDDVTLVLILFFFRQDERDQSSVSAGGRDNSTLGAAEIKAVVQLVAEL